MFFRTLMVCAQGHGFSSLPQDMLLDVQLDVIKGAPDEVVFQNNHMWGTLQEKNVHRLMSQ